MLCATLTLLQINALEWLPRWGCSRSDTRKRLEILREFLYFAFDSLLIPPDPRQFLCYRNDDPSQRALYFRQDVWPIFAKPALDRFTTNVCEGVGYEEARRILQSRAAGACQIRLLPKERRCGPS